MHKAGVLTSFNSDSNELARRMNLEAAKAVKYGNIAPAEALNFVALNPAKQLRIDKSVGSLEVGKDADFVIWSAHPLSTFAHAEQTWIEGIQYFGREENKQLARRDELERERLVQKALNARLKELKLAPAAKKSDEAETDSVRIKHDGKNHYILLEGEGQ